MCLSRRVIGSWEIIVGVDALELRPRTESAFSLPWCTSDGPSLVLAKPKEMGRDKALDGFVTALLHPTPYTSPVFISLLQSGDPFVCHFEMLENEGDTGTVLSLSLIFFKSFEMINPLVL